MPNIVEELKRTVYRIVAVPIDAPDDPDDPGFIVVNTLAEVKAWYKMVLGWGYTGVEICAEPGPPSEDGSKEPGQYDTMVLLKDPDGNIIRVKVVKATVAPLHIKEWKDD